MSPIPAGLVDDLAGLDMGPILDWWASLTEAARSAVVSLCDERLDACFFGPTPDDPEAPVPAVLGGRFIPHDDAWGLAEWGPGYFEHLLEHPELVIVYEPTLQTFHIGCSRHPAARGCLAAGWIPSDFRCPLGSRDCPMRRLLPAQPDSSPGRALVAFAARSGIIRGRS